ncbi:hypothetical protein H9660_01900 [Clostridium sp. Sa3CUN1]|uniref:Membrane associated protein n=1 Tax=Clostridium gallinarum TaxID=2762246 RepID=A0ABR8Q0F7_9CLOT|nr:germination lipoprotein GerS-related protein [Clostridium gallinarum]MBD7913891.1 hypothetical protein [Clostridium gallinarum]
MKKKLLLITLISIPIILIGIVIFFRTTAEPTNEEIIESLKNIENYKSEVEFIIKNSRDEERQDAIQYYKANLAGRIDFGEERTKIYKDDQILVKDYISNKEYTMLNSMDDLYSLSFLNKLLSYPINNDGIIEGQEEWGETEYISFTSELFLKNDTLDKVKIFIDKNQKTPIGAIVYDKNNNDRVRIVYRNFEKLKELDEELFK